MDAYPGDLLAGVFPLVFAVDGILPLDSSPSPLKNEDEKEDTENSEQKEEENEKEDAVDDEIETTTRSLFDRFLDAIAASLNEEEQDSTKPINRTGSDTLASLLRGEDKDDSSDDDDDRSQDSSRRNAFRRNSPMPSFRAKKHHSGSHSTAYARVLSLESFFQRARILSISTKHGFPPSKDPDGSQNRALLQSQTRASMAQGATGANADGILPAGWLEKHVHALPSVLLVVTTLSASAHSNQEAQNQHLLETMEHLKYNLAPKRNCHLHVVCLVDDPSPSIFATDAWLTLVKHHTELPSTSISLLSKKDLAADMATLSPSLRDLHATIRDASLAYYLKQARRAKQKHAVLGHERQPTLLPLAARYCFKIGIFYEFQLKHEKSLKFFSLAYRHVQQYYQFLLNGSPPMDVNPQEMEVKTATDDNEAGIEVSLADVSDEEEEEEDISPAELKRVISGEEAPSDMTHQCRAVADWLNFKLLKAGFDATALGVKEEGLLAASWQWRKHAQVMLRDQEDTSNPAWNFLAYVAHQRLVMSQLVERHPPSGATVPEEVLMRCSPWRNYLAAAEAELMLDSAIRKEVRDGETSAAKNGGQSMRQRFVGDLDSDGLAPKLRVLSQEDHAEKALQLITRAIELFEQEIEVKMVELESTEGETETDKPFLPSGARMYYVAGGILLAMKRYQDALSYLEKAASSCARWDGLELSIRKMLVECYSHYMPPLPVGEPEEAADSKMLGIIFHSGLSLSDVRSILDGYHASRGSESLKWNLESSDDSDRSLPFAFSVTFPGSTHATAGDTVTAIVTIKSNLNFPVHMKAVTLKSAAGQVAVPSSALMDAQNAEKGIEGSVIVPPMTAVHFNTDVILPRDLEKIASEASSSGNAAVSARPRSAGLTSAAGARLVSEDRFVSEKGNGQWSKSLLGGKPLFCGGMTCMFAPVFDDTPAEGASLRFIDVQIKKKKPKSVAPPKRTPFEENNYVESAWARPDYVPLAQGPRCLRVLGPMPHMIVTNLTDAMVNGKALEGTVNRILLKLEAGVDECCYGIEYKVTCSTTVVSSEGTTTHLNPEEGVPPSTEGVVDVKTTGNRTPVIVSRNETSSARRTTDYGYDVPPGWSLDGTGHASDKVFHHVPNLKAGESTYICFDLYRPSRSLKPLENPYDGDGQSANESDDAEVCQTNFDVSITYRQSRPAIQKLVDANQTGEKQDKIELADTVLLEHSGSVVWESPLLADFSVDGRSQRAFPSGSRHPSNYLSEAGSSGASLDTQSELALINGERTSSRCVLRSNVAGDGLGIEVARIGFEEKDISLDKDETACEFRLQSSSQTGTPGVLFASDGNDSSQVLTNGSKFGLTYSLEPLMREQYLNGSVSTRLGVIWVDWHPVSIPLPEDLPQQPGFDSESVDSHGPLRMAEPSTLKFRGPPCYIENAPFETVLESLPPSPRVATPFEMSYRISNKTGMQQKLSVLMSDQSSNDRKQSTASEGVLVSGLINGDITLAPFESQTLAYTALATKAGKTTMPALSISSDRYKTWLVKDQHDGSREIFVLP